MRIDAMLACFGLSVLAVVLLRGRARRLLFAVSGGMLIALLSGFISGFLAELVRYDAMAAVLYISPAVEEALKLVLFLLLLFVYQPDDAALPSLRPALARGLP